MGSPRLPRHGSRRTPRIAERTNASVKSRRSVERMDETSTLAPHTTSWSTHLRITKNSSRRSSVRGISWLPATGACAVHQSMRRAAMHAIDGEVGGGVCYDTPV